MSDLQQHQGHAGTFGTVTIDQFHASAKQFFDMCSQCTAEQIDNGVKALAIMYFSLQGDDKDISTAAMVLKWAASKSIEADVAERLRQRRSI